MPGLEKKDKGYYGDDCIEDARQAVKIAKTKVVDAQERLRRPKENNDV